MLERQRAECIRLNFDWDGGGVETHMQAYLWNGATLDCAKGE